MVCLYISLEYKLFILLPFLKNVFTFHCTRSWLLAFSGCGEWGLFSSCGAWASHCDGFSYCRASVCEFGPSSCGAWAKLRCSVWTPSGPGIEPVSLALAGGCSTTGPLGKSIPISPKSNHQALNIFCVPASVMGLRRWW